MLKAALSWWRSACLCLAASAAMVAAGPVAAQESAQDAVPVGQQLPAESGQQIGADGRDEPVVRAQPPEDFLDLV